MGTLPMRLLCCHAPADDDYRATLERHLALLQRQGLLVLGPVLAGDSLEPDQQLAQAEVVLFLVSSRFLENELCYELLRGALQAQKKRSLRLVPILLSPCDWESSDLGTCQVLPQNRQPVTAWQDQEAAWLNVVQEIRRILAPGAALETRAAPALPAPTGVPAGSFGSLRFWLAGGSALLLVTAGLIFHFRRAVPAEPAKALPADLRESVHVLPHAARTGLCPTAAHRLDSGNYEASNLSSFADTCGSGVNPFILGNRKLENDGQGNVALYSSEGTVLIGSGPVRCDTGTLIAGEVTITDGVCRFKASYEVLVMVTGDNSFNATVTQARSNPYHEEGKVCYQPPTCTVKFTMTYRLQEAHD